MTTSRSDNPIRQLTAAVAAIVLGVLALVVPLPAGAAGPWTTTVTVTEATQAGGLKLAVAGTDYLSLPNASGGGPNQGVYAALRDPATMTDAAINADNGIVPAVQYVPKAAIVAGSWSTTLIAAASSIDVDAAWEVIIWSAHGDITPTTLLDTVPVNLTDAQKRALDPTWVPPTTTPPNTGVPTTSPNVPTTTTPTGPTTTAPDSSSTTVPGETTTTTPGATTTTAPGRPTTTTARPTTTRPSATPGGGPSSGPYCVTEVIPGTVGAPQMSWGVKSSFVNYIESNIAKGSIDTGGGVVRTATGFTWTSGSGSLDAANRGTWSFAGYVHFTGHDNVLNLTLTNLRVRVDGPNSGTLIADIQSTDMDGNDVGGTNIAMATLGFSQVSASGGTATVTLTDAGGKAFAGYYEGGEMLDPLTVSAPGSGSQTVETCYDAQGNVISTTGARGGSGSSGGLAATGFADRGLLGVGGSLILLGSFALVVAARRRRLDSPVG